MIKDTLISFLINVSFFVHTKYGDLMIFVLLMIADIVWGLNIVITKLNYAYFHPLFLIFLKVFFSFFTMTIVLKMKNISLQKIKLKPLFINTHLINTFNFLLTYNALTYMKGTTSASLNCLAPFFMMIIVYFDTKQISKYDILLFGISLLGFFYTINFDISALSTGHFLFLLALVLYNMGNYQIKQMNDISIFLYSTYMLFIALIEMTIVCLFVTPVVKTVNSLYLWLFILTSGIGYAYIQCVSFYAMKKLGPLTTSVILALGPVFTYIFSILFLKEKMNQQLFIGFVIILFSSLLYVILREKNKHQSS